MIRYQKLLSLMGFAILISEELNVNWFEPLSCQKLLIDIQSKQNFNFLQFRAQLTLNSIWQKIPPHKPFKLCNNFQSGC